MEGDKKRKLAELDKVILTFDELDSKNQQGLQEFLKGLDKHGELKSLISFVTKENYTGKRFLANWPHCKGYIGEWGIETLLNGLTLGDFAPREKQPPRRFQIEGEVDASKEFFFIPRNSRQVILRMIQGNKKVLIQGPRMSGKTTLLREVTRHLSPEYYYIILSPKKVFGVDCTLDEMVKSASLHPDLKAALGNGDRTIENILALVPANKSLFMFCDDFDLFSVDAVRGVRLGGILNHAKLGSLVCFATALLRKDHLDVFVDGKALNFESLKMEQDEFIELFEIFAKERAFKFGDGVLDEIYQDTGGHAGLIGSCGKALEDMLPFAGNGIREWKASAAYHKILGHMSTHPVFLELVSVITQEAFSQASLLKETPNSAFHPGVTRLLPLLRRLCKKNESVKCNQGDPLVSTMINLGLAKPGIEGDSLLIQSELCRRMILPHIMLPEPKMGRISIPFKVGKVGEVGEMDMDHFLAIILSFFNPQAIENANLDRERIDQPKERVYQDQVYTALIRWFTHNPGWTVIEEYAPGNERTGKTGAKDSVDFLIFNGAYRLGLELMIPNSQSVQDHTERPYKKSMRLTEYVVVRFTQVSVDDYLVADVRASAGQELCPFYSVLHTSDYNMVKILTPIRRKGEAKKWIHVMGYITDAEVKEAKGLSNPIDAQLAEHNH